MGATRVSSSDVTPAKKQQSISSFFTPKNPVQSSPTAPLVQQSSSRQNETVEPAEPEHRPLKKRKVSEDAVVEANLAESPLLDNQTPIKEKASNDVQHHDTPSDRTSRFLLLPNGVQSQRNDENGEDETAREKRRLHERFVKRLGRPDSIAEIKRRNRFIEQDAEPEEVEGSDEDAEGDGSRKKTGPAKKGAHKLTPMEKQVIDIKRQHMDTLCVVEVGYKFRFFGEDARVAAKELGIVCIPGKFRFDEHPSEAHLDRFASASIPVHRLHVHVKRLVAAGHKVGVVRQLETAALKKIGDNRNAPFVRKLTNLYTKGTYVDDVEGIGDTTAGSSTAAPATGHLLCITESNSKGWGSDEKVQVGIIAVQPATGDIIYDDFEDGFMRSEIETRLLHIAPCEFLIVGDLSKATDKLIRHLSSSKTNVFGDKARVEYVDKPKTMEAQAYAHISDFYADKLKSTNAENQPSNVLDKVHQLSDRVTVCLSAMITHLTEYGLEHVFDLTKNFQAFSARSHMLLNGNTLSSLEIYKNQTDFTDKGSLFWVLDRTRTRYGQRLLRKWVGRPLLDQKALDERHGAVEELQSGSASPAVEKIKKLLAKTTIDLEKSLIRIYYKKCSRPELLSVLQSLQRIASEYAHVKGEEDTGFESPLVSRAIASLPNILDDVVHFLEKLNTQAAKDDDKYNFFREEHETPSMSDHKLGIAGVEADLDEHRSAAAEKLRKKRVEYVTVAGIEYLIEVENTQIKNVPASWVKVSGTKKVSRFHTPEVMKLVRERDQHKESLAAACDEAFIAQLAEISERYQSLRDCIQSLAVLDCLLSLAEVANRPGYVKPGFVDETRVSVRGGRHPMVEQLLLDSYVPNDIELSPSSTRALLITGPNMGGKSSYVRQVALICIMAQIGSYVPAEFAELGLLDAVFTRMGAFDNMMAGESTFMVELSETSDILKQASPRSLIILDELGRGTSTHDGVAIAQAVLEHVVREKQSLLLFITHYQSLSAVAGAFDGQPLKNVHMRFTESHGEGTTGDENITFLYEVGEGVAHRSYGLNVARLANVPGSVIDTARVKSQELEMEMRSKLLTKVSRLMTRSFNASDGTMLEQLVNGMEHL